jgi:hypothetical protein
MVGMQQPRRAVGKRDAHAPWVAFGAVLCVLTARGTSGCTSGECIPIIAADYDQSCIKDSDCALVAQIPQCPATGCFHACATGAINKADMARYQGDFSRSVVPEGACNCPCEGIAVCRAGKCQNGFCGPPAADTLPACSSAGGQCLYKENATCNVITPANACAFDDEMCCH